MYCCIIIIIIIFLMSTHSFFFSSLTAPMGGLPLPLGLWVLPHGRACLYVNERYSRIESNNQSINDIA